MSAEEQPLLPAAVHLGSEVHPVQVELPVGLRADSNHVGRQLQRLALRTCETQTNITTCTDIAS